MKYHFKSIKNMKGPQYKGSRRQTGAWKGYQIPIIKDAFEFRGPDISKKKEKDYSQAIV